jgi:hypothetical protein
MIGPGQSHLKGWLSTSYLYKTLLLYIRLSWPYDKPMGAAAATPLSFAELALVCRETEPE